MKWINNLNIGKRLGFLVGLSLLAIVVTALTGMANNRRLANEINFGYQAITRPLAAVGAARGQFNAMRTGLYDLAQDFNSSNQNNEFKQQILKNLADYEQNIRLYKEILDIYGTNDSYEAEAVAYLYDQLDPLRVNVEQITGIAEKVGRGADAVRMLRGNFLNVANDISSDLMSLTEILEAQAFEEDDYAGRLESFNGLISILIMAASAVFLLLIAYIIVKSITKPMKEMIVAADNLSNGNLSTYISYRSKSEIGVLANSFRHLTQVLNRIIGDMQEMAENQSKGDIEYFIETEGYKGGYREIAIGINSMIQATVNDMHDLMEYLHALGNGNFNTKIKPLPGKKAVINQSMNEIRNNLVSIHDDISKLVIKAKHGYLDQQIESDKYNGDWRSMVNEMNNLLISIAMPIHETGKVLEQVAMGNLKVSMTGRYGGEFDKLKQSINSTIAQLNFYIGDIAEILMKLSCGNYDVSVTGSYNGDFTAIQVGLNNIIGTTNKIMKNIRASAEQAASSAKHITLSSSELFDSSENQALAVLEITKTTEVISERTESAAKLAKEANSVSKEAFKNAENGDESMNTLLSAMSEISLAAEDISKVIKVIENIAFQTNILALNASVEAARAGQFGSGFAVVANEVGDLAKRSAQAVNETAALIDRSVIKAREGSAIAEKTAGDFHNILKSIQRISDMSSRIAEETAMQNKLIIQMNDGINKISRDTHINAKISQQSKAAAEELSGQSEVFRLTVADFILRECTD